ncbi:hypothetical protein DI09_29p290 [Mitosporidium daphniae]|uniref:T-complex protein 1 subunit gamma n=1 Tax=Mitosporidium daphniae TaxID=1485682 RepID=A0A098VRM5_9MICR|nr:uncharacterized protein DI09_29p290 [Mitosporidium daphniae]KGG51708.1 hypothetical protein DI09_29p290 [Mitosporidium daphniae]|eukprot:XP_013238135.1 uncharacterized protein DI09_29p290 [Mitosporidium daphniae]
MLMDPMGGIVLTNDGNAILREIEVAHPAAKSMIELARAQDEEVGDGTTSVIILSGELLSLCGSLLEERSIHPIMIINGLRRALFDTQKFLTSIAKPIDASDDQQVLSVISSSLSTKFGGRWGDLLCKLALKAVRIVATDPDSIDIKRYVRIEKIPGEEIETSHVVDGIVLNKDITHPGMRRWIENPRIMLLDCPLEYKKGESQTNLELMKEGDWQRVLEIEEEQIRALCESIIAMKPDIVFTEKGVSGWCLCLILDLAQHYFVNANITAIRRVRKTDNLRIARAVGATIVNRPEDLKESDIGKCKEPRACSVLLRGASKDVLNEIERDLHDALAVTKNVITNPMLVPGGGATEMALSVHLSQESRKLAAVSTSPSGSSSTSPSSPSMSPSASASQDYISSLIMAPYCVAGEAVEVIPRTLISNCGGDVIRTMTSLRAKHAEGRHSWGINGVTGKLMDMSEQDGSSGIWEPLSVKLQTLKTAIEV